MKYTAHVNMVTKPYIGLPTTRTPYTLVDADWATTWMIDETYEAHYHGTSVEISIYGEGPNCSVLTNRIYTCLLYTSPSPRDATLSRMPSSA